MNQTKSTKPESGAGPTPGASQTAFGEEKRAAEGLVDEAKTAASEAGTQAKKLATDKAEELQGAAASHLGKFADAVRTAGDELAEKDPGPASDLVRQAAKGLEELSGAVGRKSSGDMIASLRDFGRQNPVGFLAGSMLAGFALARFASSSSTHSTGGSAQGTAAHRSTTGGFGAHGNFGEQSHANRSDTRFGEQSHADPLGTMSPERTGAPGPQSGSHSPAGARPGGQFRVSDSPSFGNDEPRNPVPDNKGRTDV